MRDMLRQAQHDLWDSHRTYTNHYLLGQPLEICRTQNETRGTNKLGQESSVRGLFSGQKSPTGWSGFHCLCPILLLFLVSNNPDRGDLAFGDIETNGVGRFALNKMSYRH